MGAEIVSRGQHLQAINGWPGVLRNALFGGAYYAHLKNEGDFP
jgi:hypothetical protein